MASTEASGAEALGARWGLCQQCGNQFRNAVCELETDNRAHRRMLIHRSRLDRSSRIGFSDPATCHRFGITPNRHFGLRAPLDSHLAFPIEIASSETLAPALSSGGRARVLPPLLARESLRLSSWPCRPPGTALPALLFSPLVTPGVRRCGEPCTRCPPPEEVQSAKGIALLALLLD